MSITWAAPEITFIFSAKLSISWHFPFHSLWPDLKTESSLESLQQQKKKKGSLSVKRHKLLILLMCPGFLRSKNLPSRSVSSSFWCPRHLWDSERGSRCTTSNECEQRHNTHYLWLNGVPSLDNTKNRKQYWPPQTYTTVFLPPEAWVPNPGTTQEYKTCWWEPHAGIRIATLARHAAQQSWTLPGAS